MNPIQQALENTYHRADAPSSLLYERTPVIDLTTGETNQELIRKRRPLDDITYEPADEREDRVKKQKKSRDKRRKKEIQESSTTMWGWMMSHDPNDRENKPESVYNVLRDHRDYIHQLSPITRYIPALVRQNERVLAPVNIIRIPEIQQRVNNELRREREECRMFENL